MFQMSLSSLQHSIARSVMACERWLVATLLIASTALASAQCFGWESHGPILGRQQHCAAYLPTTQEILFFGGSSSTDYLFNPTSGVWTSIHYRRPAGLHGPAAAWDPATESVIVFGGTSDGEGRTYSLTRSVRAWKLLATNNAVPARRNHHAMALDESTGKIVLFGGVLNDGGALTGDTWEWDGEEWLLRNTSPPMARARHAMAYDPERGGVIMFGGQGAVAWHNDTWKWDSAVGQWIPIAFGGPIARIGHVMAYSPADGGLLMYGGNLGGQTQRLDDTWLLPSNGVAWSQVDTPFRPGARTNAVMVLHKDSTRLYLHGGSTAADIVYNDLWQWSGSATGWEQVTIQGLGNVLSLRAGVAGDPATGTALMYGGSTDMGRMWSWNEQTHGWEEIEVAGPNPGIRVNHSWVLDESTGEIVLYGGTEFVPSGIQVREDTWIFDPFARTWERVIQYSAPGHRTFASIAYDPTTQRVLMYGGESHDFNMRDIWEWDGVARTWTRIGNEPPITNRGSVMGVDRQTGGIYSVVGQSVYEFNRSLGLWFLQGTLVPENLEYPAIVYSEKYGGLILMGGRRSGQWLGWVFRRDPLTFEWNRIQYGLSPNGPGYMWPNAAVAPNGRVFRTGEGSSSWHCDGPIYCRADLNGDGRLDFFDIQMFLALFIQRDSRADLTTPNWTFDFADVQSFLNLYSGGCP
ncbi:MAG: hypothetical protein KF757_10630 [Phycisphaeraceae bacterium]|nr:hypothetical protein [Phycisphaeraceae bacterium]MCW5764212.1 hypothetical protein [Phycisphaeraceae bacterium]